MTGSTYRAAGVDIEAGDRSVELIAERIATAGAVRPEVVGEIGGFAAGFDAGFDGIKDPVLVSATDGVGTKLAIAQTLGRHDTVGADLVAMVLDDVVCSGAEPLFLLDYIACGRNDPERTAQIVGGIADACAAAGCALIGGETAEHPGMMDPEEYDLAAFGVGVVARAAMLGPDRVRPGDRVIGLRSSGLHSNGYSLVRRLILLHDLDLGAAVPGCDGTLGEELLRPTRLYAPAVLAAARACEVHAAAHVTGGGLEANLARVMPPGCSADLDRASWTVPPIFEFLQGAGGIAEDEMRRAFNLGIGMTLVVPPDALDGAVHALERAGEDPIVIGTVKGS
ncbi:MAG TPA: phosphoribosylformylglycinamidine cyclo-ligase [Actinomycetota bacterium]